MLLNKIVMVACMSTTILPTVDIPVPINPCTVSTEMCVEKYFPKEKEIALAVFMAESRLNTQAIGYNCRYGKKVTSCKKGDENKALSMDYGISQINQQNYKGNKNDLLDIETNMKVARKVYDKQTWNAWYTYRDGKYLQYLN
jgi:hypothetical protein